MLSLAFLPWLRLGPGGDPIPLLDHAPEGVTAALQSSVPAHTRLFDPQIWGSWFEFAREIVSDTRLNTLVHPTTSERFVRPARRPKYSVLSSKSLEKQGIEMPDWQDALRRYLLERKALS